MKDDNNQTEEPAISTEQAKLDAVRELLFGQNVKEYRDEIKEVRDLITEKESDINSTIDQMESDLIKRLDGLEEKMEEHYKAIGKKLDELSSSKIDRQQLSGLLIELAKQLDSK